MKLKNIYVKSTYYIKIKGIDVPRKDIINARNVEKA